MKYYVLIKLKERNTTYILQFYLRHLYHSVLTNRYSQHEAAKRKNFYTNIRDGHKEHFVSLIDPAKHSEANI